MTSSDKAGYFPKRDVCFLFAEISTGDTKVYSVQIRDVGRFLAKFNPWTNTFGYRLVRLHCSRIHSSVKLSTPKVYTRGEFNYASAFKRSLYWCQALHITNKDRYQSTSARRALALLNSTLQSYSCRIVENKRFELLKMNLISQDTLFEICTYVYLKHVRVS